MALLSLLAAWSLAAAPLAGLRDAAREAQAVEARAAAESGLAMALHRLNAPHALDARCDPDLTLGAAPWLARHLHADPTQGAWLRERRSPGLPPLACRAPASGPSLTAMPWQCHCPDTATGAGASAPSGAAATTPFGPSSMAAAFSVEWRSVLDEAGQPVTRLESVGCVRLDGDCLRAPGAGEAPAVRRSVDLHGWPLLARRPAAVLTATGPIRLSAQSVVQNADAASGGRLLHAGGRVDRHAAVLQGLPGAPAADLALQRDAGLAGLGPDGLQQALLGLPWARWQAWPQVARVDCVNAPAACAARVVALQAQGRWALAVDGDLLLPPGTELGRPDHPALLVVRGHLQVQGPARIVGLVLASGVTLDGRMGPVVWQGAGLASGAIEVSGAAQVALLPDLLDNLSRRAAVVLPRAGSWREGGATAGLALGGRP